MILSNISNRLLMIFLITFFVVIIIGCGSEKENTDSDALAKENIKKAPVEDNDNSVFEEEELRDGDDLGEPCKEHEYIVSAGNSTSLDFQILMKRQVLMIDSDKNKIFDPEDITIRNSRDYWIEMGVERSEPSTYLETINTSVDRWGVSADLLMREYGNDQGKLTSISQTLENKTKYKIKFPGTEFGIIERLGSRHTEKKVASMTDDQILEALGGVMEIKYIDYNLGTFTFPVEIISIDSENYVLNVTYDISFPDSLPKQTKGTRLWQEVRIGDSVDIRFVLRFDYDKKNGIFHVYGPWFESNCF